MLAVADTANNRVLLWSQEPRSGACQAAHAVVGQPDFNATGENGWKAVTHRTLCWPYGIWMHGGKLAVADSGNNRVMIWSLEEVVEQPEHLLAGEPHVSRDSWTN
jgi:hypothetical protein